jgi:hypothetical protein
MSLRNAGSVMHDLAAMLCCPLQSMLLGDAKKTMDALVAALAPHCRVVCDVPVKA